MLSFIVRRFAATIVVLLVASFVVYQLTAISGDPLQELRVGGDQQALVRIAYLTEVLDLDVPPALRYFFGYREQPAVLLASATWASRFPRAALR